MAITVPSLMPVLAGKFDESIVMVAPAAGQSFQPGQLLTIAGGVVSAAASAATAFFGIAMGPALDPMFGFLNPVVPVMRLRAGLTFLANLTGVLAQDNLGVQYGVLVLTNGIWQINQSNTTNLAVEVIEIPQNPGILPAGGIGDTNAWVKGAFLASAVS